MVCPPTGPAWAVGVRRGCASSVPTPRSSALQALQAFPQNRRDVPGVIVAAVVGAFHREAPQLQRPFKLDLGRQSLANRTQRLGVEVARAERVADALLA